VNSPIRLFFAAALLLATPLMAVRSGDGEAQPASGAPTLLILVRHAEKTAGGPDPSLSPEGQARAIALAHVLADVEIDALYASQFRRTQLTLQPLSEHKKIDIKTDEISGGVEAWAAAFADRLLGDHHGQTVVVAGHSNTVPVLARLLGATDAPDLEESDYDDLFMVYRSGDQVEFVHQHYGAVSD
jgi:2,3-bisphosphoglycerate-dependent phosphoglycerate mutase